MKPPLPLGVRVIVALLVTVAVLKLAFSALAIFDGSWSAGFTLLASTSWLWWLDLIVLGASAVGIVILLKRGRHLGLRRTWAWIGGIVVAAAIYVLAPWIALGILMRRWNG